MVPPVRTAWTPTLASVQTDSAEDSVKSTRMTADPILANTVAAAWTWLTTTIASAGPATVARAARLMLMNATAVLVLMKANASTKSLDMSADVYRVIQEITAR